MVPADPRPQPDTAAGSTAGPALRPIARVEPQRLVLDLGGAVHELPDETRMQPDGEEPTAGFETTSDLGNDGAEIHEIGVHVQRDRNVDRAGPDRQRARVGLGEVQPLAPTASPPQLVRGDVDADNEEPGVGQRRRVPTRATPDVEADAPSAGAEPLGQQRGIFVAGREVVVVPIGMPVVAGGIGRHRVKTTGVDEITPLVRNKALAIGAGDWLDALPSLIDALSREWAITVGPQFRDGTEAFVAEATLEDGTAAVVKVGIPRENSPTQHEIAVLRLTNGEGCVRLLRADEQREAMLLERLGPSLHDFGLPIDERLEILCTTAAKVWRPAPDCGLPTGADKGRWLVDFITRMWDELDRPCSERTIDHALASAARRIAVHDDERAVLVHGDVHEWNALQAANRADGYKLVDPDGLLAEAEYDMGILMREDPVELLESGPRDRAQWLARRTGLDVTAIWEWGVVERVSTGLLCTQIDLQPVGRQMLAAAERISASRRDRHPTTD